MINAQMTKRGCLKSLKYCFSKFKLNIFKFYSTKNLAF